MKHASQLIPSGSSREKRSAAHLWNTVRDLSRFACRNSLADEGVDFEPPNSRVSLDQVPERIADFRILLAAVAVRASSMLQKLIANTWLESESETALLFERGVCSDFVTKSN